jgi:hypothetical protein
MLERIARGRNIKLVKVDYDAEEDLAERFGIQSARRRRKRSVHGRRAFRARTRSGSIGKGGR